MTLKQLMESPTSETSEEEFVRAWNDADTVDGAAIKLGVTRNSAQTRAQRLRKRGHELKMFRDSPRLSEWDPELAIAAGQTKRNRRENVVRRATSVLVDQRVLHVARALKINVSAVLEHALLKAIAAIRERDDDIG